MRRAVGKQGVFKCCGRQVRELRGHLRHARTAGPVSHVSEHGGRGSEGHGAQEGLSGRPCGCSSSRSGCVQVCATLVSQVACQERACGRTSGLGFVGTLNLPNPAFFFLCFERVDTLCLEGSCKGVRIECALTYTWNSFSVLFSMLFLVEASR